MSNALAVPKSTRSSTSFLMASAFAAVALNMAIVSLEMASVNTANAWPVATEAAAPLPAAFDRGAAAFTAAGIDHGTIAPDAVSAGDGETVEMSIAAYDRAVEPAPSR